jgi:large subunit ribosomal protein L10
VNRDQKANLVAEIHNRFANASVAFVTTNRGLSVEQANVLRRSLKAMEGEYKIAKHTLVRRALQGTNYTAIGSFLEGPRGLVFGYAARRFR